MRRLALAPLMLVAACAEPVAEPANVAADPLQPAEADILPQLILYRTAENGGPEAFMEALVGGRLDLSGPCVAVDTGEGPVPIVTTMGEVSRDEVGVVTLTVGPHSFRDGDWIQSGGGWVSASPAEEVLRQPIDPACDSGDWVEMSFIYPMPPGEVGMPDPAPEPDTV